jgi:hypothetical protein
MERREDEKDIEDLMYPPVTQVQDPGDGGLNPSVNPQGPKSTPDSKTNKVEKKNFKNA